MGATGQRLSPRLISYDRHGSPEGNLAGVSLHLLPSRYGVQDRCNPNSPLQYGCGSAPLTHIVTHNPLKLPRDEFLVDSQLPMPAL